MNVFLAYGDIRDQATALRLQSLAAVNGLRTFVPPAYTRTEWGGALDSDSAAHLDEANVVLAVIQFGFSDACRFELNASLAQAKPTIAMVGSSWLSAVKSAKIGALNHQALPAQRGGDPLPGLSIVEINPLRPEYAERKIVGYLKEIEAEQSARNALFALGTIALGLLIFAPQD